MIEEKRKYIRLNLLADVIHKKRAPTEQEKLMLMKNISSGGICIIVYEKLKVSDVLDLKIYLPGENEPIDIVGRVAWLKEFSIGDSNVGKRYDAGIEFIKINEQDRNRINKYVFNALK
jgi:c-di-GMP-binding flagellar brake protein YcgR